MKFSLLYKKEGTFKAPCRVIYDLSIDRAVHAAVRDTKRADYFLTVLSEPETSVENIKYRQQIYSDLAANPGLFGELQLVFTRYDKIRSDWHELRLGALPTSGASVNPESLLEHTFASLKVTAMFPGTIASYYGSLLDVLTRYDIRSEGLCSMRNYCSEMTKNRSLRELVDTAQLFRYKQPEDFDFGISAVLDETLRLKSCGLSDITEHKPQTSNPFAKLFSRKKNDSSGKSYEIGANDGPSDKKSKSEPVLDDISYENAVFLANEALSRIDSALTKVTNDVYETFFGMSRELMFYEAALNIRSICEEGGIPCCMPEILPEEEDTFEATELRELLLISGGATALDIVPNDICLPKDRNGILIRGMTDTGKTVCLRSIGAAQLLAQAGLPVPAKSARLSVRRGFFSHFSSAEEEFMAGDAAGRFDQEAREVSKILSSLEKYSLVFFNETFQTTSYREGTEGMANILRILPRLSAKYVFVTHLTNLFEIMKNDGVILAHTSDAVKYKIELQ